MNTAKGGQQMSEAQRRKIFALCREAGIDNDLRRDMMFTLTGKSSMADFTSANASVVIDHLLKTSPSPEPPGRTTSLRPASWAGMTSPLHRDAAASVLTPGSAAAILPERSGGTPGSRSGNLHHGGPAPIAIAGNVHPQINADFHRLNTGKVFGRLRGEGTSSLHQLGCEGKSADKTPAQIHKLPSPAQLAVLEGLYKYAGYETEGAKHALVSRIEKHPRPRSMWEAEEMIFALVPQAAPKLLAAIQKPAIKERLTPFELGFLFTNRVTHDLRGNLVKTTFNAAELELEAYVAKANQRGKRTMPRFSLSKLFEILGRVYPPPQAQKTVPDPEPNLRKSAKSADKLPHPEPKPEYTGKSCRHCGAYISTEQYFENDRTCDRCRR